MCLSLVVSQGSLERLKNQKVQLCDSYGRPHTISSAYERSTAGRPSITAQTFVDPAAEATRAAVLYATPSALVNSPSRLHVADIQSRLSVIYGRRVSQNINPQMVNVPSVPAEYATCSSQSVADDNLSKAKQTAPLFHRSCSLPPPVIALYI